VGDGFATVPVMIAPLPDYWLPRPPIPTDSTSLAAFDQLFEDAVQQGGEINYRLAAPRWQFACYIADTRPVLLHGSGDAQIKRFEPRQPNDTTEFGNQLAVYAASDGVWPLYYAILDRGRHPMSMINASVRAVDDDGSSSLPHYYFSISAPALAARAFRPGTLYFLPRTTFRQQPDTQFHGQLVRVDHWASPEAVVPLCQLTVTPDDFPHLGQIRGHDDATTLARARANPDGFPWIEAGNP